MILSVSFNPLHCGAVVASVLLFASVIARCSCFNPLHCGAVVASSPPRPGCPPQSGGFNPLHCGAVVASRRRTAERRAGRDVSIPFIAGQWSLPYPVMMCSRAAAWRFNPLHCGAVVASSAGEPSAAEPSGFNPLHCGAVVASGCRRSPQFCWLFCFNPLHCGAVVASTAPLAERRGGKEVSIPFIAGQWSLHMEDRNRTFAAHTGFNPLHCGAVVASRLTPRLLLRLPCFNPLHCGAVVASGFHRTHITGRDRVSIPFIAGQWSLQKCLEDQSRMPFCFNPLHCGAVVASTNQSMLKGIRDVSIPFIAGQWSLQGPGSCKVRD